MANIEGGFFTGAKEIAEYLVKQGEDQHRAEAAPQIVDVDGYKFLYNPVRNTLDQIMPKKHIPEDDPVPGQLAFFSLEGFADYIEEDVEGVIPTDGNKLIVQVCDEHTVLLLSKPSANHSVRHIIAKCSAKNPDIDFGYHMDSETFNTMLLSKFIQTESRDKLFGVVSGLVKEQSCNTSDDGVSQVVTVKAGVSMASNVTFKNPVPLRPMRTFSEIEQPESNFTLRVNEKAQVALYEADGGAWRIEAVKKIKEYLDNKLYCCNVVVLA